MSTPSLNAAYTNALRKSIGEEIAPLKEKARKSRAQRALAGALRKQTPTTKTNER
jgi:hypothetical protein